MARLLDKQRRAHLLLADLVGRETATQPSVAAAPATAAAEHPWARLKAAAGSGARAASSGPVWAHQRLAARCSARAGWHEACAAFLATSLEASGAGPTRAAARRPQRTERR
jgi:hypothetical protein